MEVPHMEGVLFDVIQTRMIEKKKEYNKLPLPQEQLENINKLHPMVRGIFDLYKSSK